MWQKTQAVEGCPRQSCIRVRSVGGCCFRFVRLASRSVKTTNPRRKISAPARRKISLAQKARWAKRNSHELSMAKPRRTISAAGRRKIAAAQRARWAKVKQEKKAA